MSNEAALLCIVAIWFLSGRGLNLCFIIFGYYCVYLISTDLPSQVVQLTSINSTVSYYLTQAVIDCSAIIACCIISLKYKKSVIIYFAYAAIIATSLICELLMMLDQGFGVGALFFIHEHRQLYSIPLDLLFAAIGSGVGERLFACVSLLIRRGSRYNRFYSD